MTQKQKNILCLILPIVCAVVALSSVVGVGIAVARMEDIKEIVETRLSEPAPVETAQAISTTTYAPSPEPATENSAPTKPAAEQPKQKAAAEPAVKQEPSKRNTYYCL